MDAVLNAEIRSETGKGAAHRLRQQGVLPAVLYGESQKHLSLNLRELQKLLSSQGSSQLVTLKVKEGRKKQEFPVLIKEIQYHPVKGHPLHVDLYQVSMEREVVVKIPVVLTGEEERENDGSIIDLQLYEVEVSCLPVNIPAKIDVDISGLTMNNSITLADVTPPSGVEFVTPLSETVVTAHAPRVEEVAEEAEAEGETESEATAEEPAEQQAE